jgi:hypothetical protein
LKSRVSSAVEQRFCKPLVGSSILSPGTTFSAARQGSYAAMQKHAKEWRRGAGVFCLRPLPGDTVAALSITVHFGCHGGLRHELYFSLTPICNKSASLLSTVFTTTP